MGNLACIKSHQAGGNDFQEDMDESISGHGDLGNAPADTQAFVKEAIREARIKIKTAFTLDRMTQRCDARVGSTLTNSQQCPKGVFAICACAVGRQGPSNISGGCPADRTGLVKLLKTTSDAFRRPRAHLTLVLPANHS